MKKLEDHGAQVSYNDPYISVIRVTREYAKFAGRASVAVSSDYDLIIIVTAHDEYKMLVIEKIGIPILDTRNIIRIKHPFVYKA